MKPSPTVAETFAALDALDAEVHKNSHAIDQWCIHMPRTKANQPTLLLMLMSRQINEELMKRLWAAEVDAKGARIDARTAQDEIQEWQITALAIADPKSDSLH
jgi:hypothetical protein